MKQKREKSCHYQAKKRRKQFTIIKPEAGGDMLAALQPQSPPLSIKSSKKSENCKKCQFSTESVSRPLARPGHTADKAGHSMFVAPGTDSVTGSAMHISVARIE